MKKIVLIFLFAFISKTAISQYDINSFHYGLAVIKNVGQAKELGLGVRAEYAMNCSTTFIAEYNRSFLVNPNTNQEGFNEMGLGVNMIMFNWYPSTITAGIGYIGNDSSIFETIEDDAYLSFRTGDFNHGAQIKIRWIQELTESLHFFGELNVKSLGRRYDTVVIGLSYDFY